MNLDLESITTISRSVALEHSESLRVVGVTSTDGGSDRAELLVTIDGCHREPCSFIVNVSRASRDHLEEDVSVKLRDALRKHLAAGVSRR
jgi:hypothetical protein